jgi:hypothetical protein
MEARMKELGETLAVAVLVMLIMGLFFLFKGDPDLWDKLHALAMIAVERK